MKKFGKLAEDDENDDDWGNDDDDDKNDDWGNDDWGNGTPPPKSPNWTPSPKGKENDFQSEINVYERVGMPGATAEFLGVSFGGGALSDLQRKINKMFQDPSERFAVYVDAIYRNLSDKKGVKLNDDDIFRMLTKIKTIKNIQHKNPTAYILGYIASDGGRNITKESMKNVITNIIPSVRDWDIKPADVLRYARFWMEL